MSVVIGIVVGAVVTGVAAVVWFVKNVKVWS